SPPGRPNRCRLTGRQSGQSVVVSVRRSFTAARRSTLRCLPVVRWVADLRSRRGRAFCGTGESASCRRLIPGSQACGSTSKNEQGMPSPGDLLLYAFTNWKSVTWATFKTAVDEISAAYWMQRSSEAQEPASVLRNRILRTLEYLGHCDSDFDRDAGRVFVAPPALVLLPAAGFPRAVVSGARSPDMLAGLRSAIGQAKTRIRIEVRQPADPFLPSRIELEATEYEMFCDLASKFGMAFDEVSAAWSIAQFSGDLKTYLAGLAWSSEPELGWARLDFDPVRETFARPEAGCQPSLRLSSYQDPMRTIRRHYLWQASENAAVDLDWGRYAVFAASGSRVISYDPK